MALYDEEMTSRPAAPESETPETDAVVHNGFSLARVSRSLERRLSLSQTEIKGHMRVEDELRAECAALAAGSCVHDLVGDPYGHFECSKVLEQAAELKKMMLANTEAGREIYQLESALATSKARIAELEKAIVGECEECGQTILTPLHPLPSVEKDAARYRWLRANHLQTGTDSWIRTGDDLEEAIDAALKSRA